jgi:hypothetical protein
MRERKPDIYIRVVAGLLPKDANINVETNEAFVELGGGSAMASEMIWRTAWMRSKNRPLLFVTDVLGAKPEPWQAVELHDHVSIRSGHATFESWLILWLLLTRKNCKIPVAANSQDQLRDSWPEISKWHKQLPDALRTMIDVQTERIVVMQDPQGAFAVRRTASRTTPKPCKAFTPSIYCS